MHLARRMRLIWHKLWLIPLVGATADVVAGEAAKLGGVTVPIPWLFSAIGVVGMIGAAVVRAYSVPLIPEGLETPDEALTRRSRILGERLGATPVRVFVCDLPKLRGKVDTFIDGHDLFVSERVAEMPEAERDFVLARALVERGPAGQFNRFAITIFVAFAILAVLALAASTSIIGWGEDFVLLTVFALQIWFLPVNWFLRLLQRRRPDLPENWSTDSLALAATGDLPAAVAAMQVFAGTEEEKKRVVGESSALESWWKSTGQKAVEASEWYQRERSLTAKAE